MIQNSSFRRQYNTRNAGWKWEEQNNSFEILHTTHSAHVEVTRRNCRQESGVGFAVNFIWSASIIIAHYGSNSCDSFMGILYFQKTVSSAKNL
jgi:hypothetical protein